MPSATRQRPFFRRFLISYGVTLLFPIAASAGFYLKSVDFVYAEMRDADSKLIAQAMEVMDATLQDIRGVADFIRLGRHYSALSQTSEPLMGRFYYRMSLLQEELETHVVTQGLLSMFFLYLPENGYVIAQDTAYSAEMFFNHVFSYSDYNYDAWIEILSGEPEDGTLLPAATMIYQSQTVNGIPSIWSLSNETTSLTTGFAVFVLDVDYLDGYLHRLLRAPDSSVYVTDAQGRMLLNVNGSVEEFAELMKTRHADDRTSVGGGSARRYSVSYTSKQSHLTFYALTPESYILEKISFIKAIAVLLFAGAGLVSFVTALTFSRQQARPLLHMLDQLASQSPDSGAGFGNDPFEYLNTRLKQLLDSSTELNETFHVQRAYLKQFALSRIIRGEYTNQAQILRLAETLSIDLDAHLYLLFCVRFFGPREPHEFPPIEANLLSRISLEENLAGGQGAVRALQIDISGSELSVLIRGNDIRPDSLRAQSRALIESATTALRQKYGIPCCWGGSSVFSNIGDAHLHYEHAQGAAGYCTSFGEATGMMYDELPDGNYELSYPMDLENRVMLFVRAGECKDLRRLLEFNHQQNRRAICEEAKRHRYLELLKNTFYRLELKGIPEYDTLSHRLRSVDDIETSFEEMLDAFTTVCSCVNRSKKSHKANLKNEIIEYVSRNTADPNLGLQQVADLFHLSTGYLSHFFREQTGETFSSYVERLRITHAKELLHDTSLSVKEIAERVGYTNPHSFRRAFHKVVLQIPSEYRNR